MTNLPLRRIATLFLVAFVAVGLTIGPAAAATTTLSGDGSDEVTAFDASDDDHLEYSLEAEDTDFDTDGTDTVYMNVTYDGTEYAEAEQTIDDGTATSETLNMSHADLSNLPGDAGETTTVTVTAWGENADGDVTTAADEFDVDITFDSSYAATSVDDSAADIEEIDPGYLSLSTWTLGTLGDDDPADLHTYEETVGVDGDETTVTVNDATSDGEDAFSGAMGDGLSDGDIIFGASAAVDGTPVLAFEGEADDSLVDPDNDTYAVHDGGAWTFSLGDDYSDAEEVDVYVSSQSYTSVEDFEGGDLADAFFETADLGTWDVLSSFGVSAFGAFGVAEFVPFVGGFALPAGGLSLAGVGLVAGRRRLATRS